MDSQDLTITYQAIQERTKQDAMERMPDLPKQNTVDAWEDYITDLEDMDPMEIAHESGEWDWVIYYHRAMELCQAVPSDVLHEAESEYAELVGLAVALEINNFGLYELACQLAGLIVENEVREQVESIRDELIEMANNQLENLE